MKRTALVFFAYLFFFSLIVESDCFAQEWGTSIPGSGSFDSITADSSGMTIIVASRNSGFWITEDGGQNWQPYNSVISQERMAITTSIDIYDPDGEMILAECWYENILLSELEEHSFDGGQTWSSFDFDNFWPNQIPGPSTGEWSLLHEPEGRTYFATQHAFAHSDQYGEPWMVVDVSTLVHQTRGIFVHPDDPDTVYVYGYWTDDDYEADGPAGGIIRSTDSGLTWTRVTLMEDICPAARGFVRSMAMLPDGDIIAATNWHSYPTPYPQLLRSQDQGENWEWIPYAGLPDSFVSETILAVPEIPGRLLLASARQHGLWTSDDSGATWERMLNGLPAKPEPGLELYRNPFGGQIYVGLAGQGIYQSTDGGESWQAIPGPPTGDLFSTYYKTQPVDPDGFWQGTSYGRLWFAEGNSTDFVPIEPVFEPDVDTHLSPFAMPEGTIGFLKKREPFGDNDSYNSIVTIDTDTWEWTTGPETTFGPQEGFILVRSFSQDDQLQLMGYNEANDFVYLSDDMGQTWDQVVFDDRKLTFITRHRDEYYAVDILANEVIRTPALDQPWESTNFPEDDEAGLMISPMLSLGDTLYACAEEKIWAFYPDDTWELRSIPGFTLAWDLVTTPDDTFFVASFGIEGFDLHVSHYWGLSWQDQDLEFDWPNQSSQIYDLTWDNDRQRLWVNTGNVLAYLDFAETSVDDETWTLRPAEFELLNAYPNPFNAQTTVTYSLSNAQDVRLEVYDLLGRRVATLVDGMRQPGQHQTVFDAAGLASGSYYLRYCAGERRENRKLVLIR